MDIAKPFIRLPYGFDAKRLAREVTALPEAAWMAHPSGMKGNSAVPLISHNGGDNDDFEGSMRVTRHLNGCEYVRQVMASFDEVLGRTRLMKLAGGSEVSMHVDFNYHWYTRVRIHIPIITNPAVTFYCADQQVHMKAGECWIFNSWRRHRVTNAGDQDRIHLVIDAAGSSRFWNTVRDMEQYDPVTDQAAVEKLVSPVPFGAGKEVTILTEKYNICPVMSPGEVDALVSGLVRDFEHNPKNDPKLIDAYERMLLDFAKDWRETWHLYGYQKDGWAHYQKIIDKVYEQLHPDMRALVTESNDIGVNPIIVQRILKSALAVDTMDQFIDELESNQ